jgi:hypothetical protein
MMETVKAKTNLTADFRINLSITKREAMVLQAIVGYGADPFLDVFYPKLGRAYLFPLEQDLRSLFKKVWEELPVEIGKIESAEKAINDIRKSLA